MNQRLFTLFVLSSAAFDTAFSQSSVSHRECLIEDLNLSPAIARPSGDENVKYRMKRLAQSELAARPLRAERQGEIAVLYDDGRVFGPPNWRDLESVTLRFEPQSGIDGGYRFSRLDLDWREPGDQPILYDAGWPQRSVERDLPFDFQFDQKTWRRVSINSTGSISFDFREDRLVRPRYYRLSDYGPAQLVRERMVAALWTTTYDFDDHQLRWSASEDEAVATWRVTESYARGQAFRKDPGYDEFQIVLRRDGVILISYRTMTTPVGVAGVFPGLRRFDIPTPLASFPVPSKANIPAYTDIARVWAERVSSTEILLGMELRGDPPAGRGRLLYRHFLDTSGPFASGGLPFGSEETIASAFWQGDRWKFHAWGAETEGHVSGREVRIVVPLNRVAAGGKVRWFADAVDFDLNGAFSQFSAQILEIAQPERDRPADLTRMPEGSYQGAIFEVFHAHPFRITDAGDSTRLFYDHFADTADFLVFYTTSRLDSPEGAPRASGALAGGILGIGIPNEWRRNLGSAGRLQAFQEVSWVDSYAAERSGLSRDFGPFDSYSVAMFLNGHELGHRWGILFDPPSRSGYPRISDNVHWLSELHHPARQCEPLTPCSSLMGGSVWEEAEPGFFLRKDRNGYLQRTGYGPLDLYAMGLASPDELGDLFALTSARAEFRPGFGHGFAAVRERFEIDSIVSALGPRWPDAAHSLKEFNTVYVLYVMEGDTLRPEHVEKVNGIRQAWLEHFPAATMGRGVMKSELVDRPRSRMQVVAGDHQWVETGAALSSPVVFRAMDIEGKPLTGVDVVVALVGEGRLDAQRYITDNEGVVKVTVTAGASPGRLVLTTTFGTADSAKATVHVAPPASR